VAETQNLKLQIPELTETADGPDAFRDLAQGVEDYVYNRVLPTGVLRAPEAYWGSAGSLPNNAAVRVGDTATHTGLRCLMVCTALTANGPFWEQLRPAVVSTASERLLISQQFKELLTYGFTVLENTNATSGRAWEWRGFYWHLTGGRPPSVSAYRLGPGSTGRFAYTTIGMERTKDADTWNMLQGGGFLVAPVTGAYRAWGVITWGVNGTGVRHAYLNYRPALNNQNDVSVTVSGAVFAPSAEYNQTVPTTPVLMEMVKGSALSLAGIQTSSASSLAVLGTSEHGTQNTGVTMELAYQTGE